MVGSDGSLGVDFDGRSVEIAADADAVSNVQLAYATSIHKVQGSEFPCAIVVAHKSHSFMHHRNLLYTAVTRAKESVIVLGDRWGIANCATKRQVDRRNTFLLSFFRRPALEYTTGRSKLLPADHRLGTSAGLAREDARRARHAGVGCHAVLRLSEPP